MIASPAWLMLVSSLPGQTQTARMRIWRALKAAGAGALRDGVYVLPHTIDARPVFQERTRDVIASGGSAQIIAFDAQDRVQQQSLIALFDRGADFAALFKHLGTWRAGLKQREEAASRRELATLRRDAAALAEIDFFPGPSQRQMESALAEAEAALNARFSPDEPHAARGDLPRCDPAKFRGRAWATREHMWVDRVASAWLIRRFIDRKAKFLWLKKPKDCPKTAIGFDFDGAQFTHIGARVTFEVLTTVFGLDHDHAIARLGALVHYLDVGGIPMPEAAGFVAIMTGARARQTGDDKLLQSMSVVLDALHAGYAKLPEDAP